MRKPSENALERILIWVRKMKISGDSRFHYALNREVMEDPCETLSRRSSEAGAPSTIDSTTDESSSSKYKAK